MAISLNEKKVLDRAARILYREIQAGDVLSSPARVREFLRFRHAALEHEVFSMIVLNNRHRVLDYVELFRGTIDGASVHPREVLKEVLARNGAAVLFAHGHPSGGAEPSQADEHITKKLIAALGTCDIRVLDHLVIGNPDITSLAERGLI